MPPLLLSSLHAERIHHSVSSCLQVPVNRQRETNALSAFLPDLSLLEQRPASSAEQVSGRNV